MSLMNLKKVLLKRIKINKSDAIYSASFSSW